MHILFKQNQWNILRFHFRCSTVIGRFLCQETDVRVRFAPSPTGFLHLGGLRTALYNFFFAKSHNGTFILRIEDTDQTRLVDGAVKKLEYDLEWAGLKPDESPSVGGSFGPYLQSQRLSLYKEEVQKLLENGSAYYCFCNDRRLSLLRKDAIRRREVPKYDNRCRLLTKKETEEKLNSSDSYCIRFKLEHCSEPFEDLVYGKIVHDVAAFEGDPIIIKSDGFPTYHFANVVDDHYMKISHVLRGVEWQQSTVKHLLLYRAFNWIPPKFAHLPLLMNADGTKLSKRNSNMTVEAYRNDGIYPLALINLIISSGGGFSKDIEDQCKIKRLQDLIKTNVRILYMVQKLCIKHIFIYKGDFIIVPLCLFHEMQFEINLINQNNCQVQYHRLDEYNCAVIQDMISDEITLQKLVLEVKKMIETQFSTKENIEISCDETKIRHVLKWNIHRISRLKDLVGPDFAYLWILPPTDNFVSQEKTIFEVLKPLINDLKKNDNFDETFLSNYFKTFTKEHKIEYGVFMKFLRLCLSGLKKGPGIIEIMTHLGKDAVLQRLQRAELFYENKIK